MPETSIAIPTRRGLKLAAVLNIPDSRDRVPFVIILHGRTGWKEEEHLTTLAEELCLSGIAAVRFDAPGSGASEGTWADDYRISTYVEALLVVHTFVLRNFAFDEKRFGLWAHSMGGLVAVRAAPRLQGLAAFCGCEITIGPGILDSETIENWRKTGWREEESEHFGCLRFPLSFYEDRLEQSRLASVRDVTAASLFIAGSSDYTAPAAEVRLLFEAANEPRQYREFEIDHMFKHEPEKLAEVNRVTLKFFINNLLSECGSLAAI